MSAYPGCPGKRPLSGCLICSVWKVLTACGDVCVFSQADFPSVAGLIEDLDYQLDADDISGQGHKEKKYYIDTVNIKIPRKGMEMTGFLRDGMSKCCSL